jgi:hypothetical protein
MPIEYALEIYDEGNADAAPVTFKSTSPFMSISVGDLIHPAPNWPDTTPDERLRVASVEHEIRDAGDGLKHRVLVYINRVVAGTALPG